MDHKAVANRVAAPQAAAARRAEAAAVQEADRATKEEGAADALEAAIKTRLQSTQKVNKEAGCNAASFFSSTLSTNLSRFLELSPTRR